MTQGRKYDPSPVSTANNSSDNWLMPMHSIGSSRSDHRSFHDAAYKHESDVAAASNQDHLLFAGLLLAGLAVALYVFGLL